MSRTGLPPVRRGASFSCEWTDRKTPRGRIGKARLPRRLTLTAMSVQRGPPTRPPTAAQPRSRWNRPSSLHRNRPLKRLREPPCPMMPWRAQIPRVPCRRARLHQSQPRRARQYWTRNKSAQRQSPRPFKRPRCRPLACRSRRPLSTIPFRLRPVKSSPTSKRGSVTSSGGNGKLNAKRPPWKPAGRNWLALRKPLQIR